MNYQYIETATDKEFIQTTAQFLKQKIETAISQHNACIIGLSGGTTPQPIYKALGKEKIDWTKVHAFLVDERYVPSAHPQSNQGMIRTILPKIVLTAPNTALSIPQCVEKYAQDLHKLWSEHLPDIIILGMGSDGHIASLFPPLPQNLRDDTSLVAHTHTDTFDIPDRITLTLNPILAASSHLILLKGEDKKIAWNTMLKKSERESSWPVKTILTQSDITVFAQW